MIIENNKVITQDGKTIHLSSLQLSAVKAMEHSSSGTVNTFELRNAGIASGTQTISVLKARGALVTTIYKPAFDSLGNLHNQIAHYQLVGWI